MNFVAEGAGLAANVLWPLTRRYLDEMARIDRQETQDTCIDRVTHLKSKLDRVREEVAKEPALRL